MNFILYQTSRDSIGNEDNVADLGISNRKPNLYCRSPYLALVSEPDVGHSRFQHLIQHFLSTKKDNTKHENCAALFCTYFAVFFSYFPAICAENVLHFLMFFRQKKCTLSMSSNSGLSLLSNVMFIGFRWHQAARV